MRELGRAGARDDAEAGGWLSQGNRSVGAGHAREAFRARGLGVSSRSHIGVLPCSTACT